MLPVDGGNLALNAGGIVITAAKNARRTVFMQKV